jgi:hypothetical protein
MSVHFGCCGHHIDRLGIDRCVVTPLGAGLVFKNAAIREPAGHCDQMPYGDRSFLSGFRARPASPQVLSDSIIDSKQSLFLSNTYQNGCDALLHGSHVFNHMTQCIPWHNALTVLALVGGDIPVLLGKYFAFMENHNTG